MKTDFRIEKRAPEQIEIVHAAEGHRYAFRVGVRHDGRRVISTEYKLNSDAYADHDGTHFIHDAWTFAEREFRMAGEID